MADIGEDTREIEVLPLTEPFEVPDTVPLPEVDPDLVPA